MDIHGPLETRDETRCAKESASPAWLATPLLMLATQQVNIKKATQYFKKQKIVCQVEQNQ